MKNLVLLLAIVSLVIFSSCGKDDDEVVLVNQILFEGAISEVTTGLVEDYGVDDQLGYYRKDFTVTDNTISLSSENDPLFSTSTEVLVYAALFSNSNQFTNGTFEYSSGTGNLPTNSFFLSAKFADDVTDANSIEEATGGTIDIAGSANSYTITFNLTFDNNRTLTGNFTGDFLFSDKKE
ncbi:MAG: hypothetical protein RIM99_04300 [Cyclobacteriaceae bacterium]